ncbi:MAG: hypothetical protein GWN14_06915 [candidate division Zixibacteria bacterium]|nr:hypothetical protein [candidate division Zixibacteria bacterium]NIW44530.1 hypothetical protein [Gammaproteobacteria bacterium]NIX55655.1 hypothetical protein [candidate division Zixibacteria bacterium]
MFTRSMNNIAVLISIILLFGLNGCSHDDRFLEPAEFSTDPIVFRDEFGSNVTFQAFAGSKLDAVDLDQVNTYLGSQALQVIVPDVGDPSGSYAGGAFTTNIARNLTEYNALTFYAKASRNATLNVAGIGNDNTGTSRFTAEVNNLALTPEWQKYIIPIPLSDKLTSERGLFYFAEGPEEGNGYQIWFDEIIFETLGTISDPQPAIPITTINAEENDTITIAGATVTFDVDGISRTVSAMQGYFTFFSSDETVVNVAGNGVITAVGPGTAELTANLGTVQASGRVTVEVTEPAATPTTPAPVPMIPEADVISLFSNVYTDVTVNTWSAEWDFADVFDVTIGTDDVKKYEIQDYAGIEFADPTLDVSGMTHFHMDIWTPNSTALPATFSIKLVDFGANGAFGGGDDVEDELIFNRNTSPALETGTWISIDMPLTAFSGLLTKRHLAQLIIAGDLSIVYVDNIYFYDAGEVIAPTIPAPVPDEDPSNVISLFSDSYPDVPVNTWSTIWDDADLEDYMIGADNVKKYTNLLFAAIEFKNPTIDASSMTHFHMDVWTPNPTASPSVFKIKLVDFGANGIYEGGGGDDVEDEIILDENTMNTGIWVSIDVPLSNFSELTTRGHLGQLIISGDPNTLYIDNVYFYDSGIPEAPLTAAPTPTVAAGNVISLFSDAYTDVSVDTWSAVWDTADVQNYTIDSDTTKKYTNLLFAGIEFTSNTIDASAMTHFHMDVWTPDPTDAPAVFRIKLVDFGANGVWDDGGDDVEHEITLDENTMNTGSWISIELPLTAFVNLTTRAHLAQLIISGDPNTVYVDNIYFHR